MRLAIFFMPSFPYYFIAAYNYTTNHRIRRNISCSKFCQLQTAVHVLFVIHFCLFPVIARYEAIRFIAADCLVSRNDEEYLTAQRKSFMFFARNDGAGITEIIYLFFK